MSHDQDCKTSQTIAQSTSCERTGKIIQQVLSVTQEQHEKVTVFSILATCYESTNFSPKIELCHHSITKDTDH